MEHGWDIFVTKLLRFLMLKSHVSAKYGKPVKAGWKDDLFDIGVFGEEPFDLDQLRHISQL